MIEEARTTDLMDAQWRTLAALIGDLPLARSDTRTSQPGGGSPDRAHCRGVRAHGLDNLLATAASIPCLDQWPARSHRSLVLWVAPFSADDLVRTAPMGAEWPLLIGFPTHASARCATHHRPGRGVGARRGRSQT